MKLITAAARAWAARWSSPAFRRRVRQRASIVLIICALATAIGDGIVQFGRRGDPTRNLMSALLLGGGGRGGPNRAQAAWGPSHGPQGRWREAYLGNAGGGVGRGVHGWSEAPSLALDGARVTNPTPDFLASSGLVILARSGSGALPSTEPGTAPADPKNPYSPGAAPWDDPSGLPPALPAGAPGGGGGGPTPPASAAPEPASWAELLLGFAAVGALLRGRRGARRRPSDIAPSLP